MSQIWSFFHLLVPLDPTKKKTVTCCCSCYCSCYFLLLWYIFHMHAYVLPCSRHPGKNHHLRPAESRLGRSGRSLPVNVILLLLPLLLLLLLFCYCCCFFVIDIANKNYKKEGHDLRAQN